MGNTGAASADTGNRGQVDDDTAMSGCGHVARRFATPNERASKVRGEYPVPLLVTRLEYRCRRIDPALFTQMSMPPIWWTARSAVAAIDEERAASSGVPNVATPKRPPISSAVDFAPTSSISPITTDAPASARRQEMAAPRPRAPPSPPLVCLSGKRGLAAVDQLGQGQTSSRSRRRSSGVGGQTRTESTDAVHVPPSRRSANVGPAIPGDIPAGTLGRMSETSHRVQQSDGWTNA